MEKALRESEERYRALFEAIDEGFCVIEVLFDDADRPIDYRFAEINPAFTGQSGLGDAVGRRMKELAPDHEQYWFDIYGRIALTRQPERFIQEAAQLGERWFDVYAFPVGATEDRTVGVLFRDISERRRIEQQLRESDQAKDEFLAVLAHELRNPLAALYHGVETLPHARQRPELLDSLNPMMKRQLGHLVRLVDDLLDVSRIRLGKIQLARTMIDANEAIRFAVEQTSADLAQRQHELVVELADEPLSICADMERLTQVIANLLNNAAKYTRTSGNITVRSSREPGTVLITVRDTGSGIPPEFIDTLFNLFSQAPGQDVHSQGGGLGIGLALAQQLVELHGGTISARSAGPDQGSEFTIRLPGD